MKQTKEDDEMKKGLTELVFILDRSGSMGGLETDTIGGYNAMLAKQQAMEGECFMTTILFDDRYELLHDRIDIRGVSPISSKEYYVRGSTALLDAVGRTLRKIENVQAHTAEEFRSEKVMVVIITDGYENASREFSQAQVKEMIASHKTKDQWEFVFLGANIDAVEVAGGFGIAADRAQTYHADKQGVALNFRVVSNTVSRFRSGEAIDACWKEEIEKDYRNRGGNPG